MIRWAAITLVVAGLRIVACTARVPAANGQPQAERVDTLVVPAGMRADQDLELRVITGPLPERSRVVVRLQNGEIVGAVAPYGAAAGGSYTLTLARSAVTEGHVILRLSVELMEGRMRAPTSSEVLRLELASVR